MDKVPNPYKIKSRIGSGDPLAERILQFADFFVYAPHNMLVTGKEKRRHFEEIKHKYYNFDGARFYGYRLRRFLGLSQAMPVAFHAGGTVLVVRLIVI